MWSSLVKIKYTELKLSCGNDPVVKIIFIVTMTLTVDLMTLKYIGFFTFHRGIMWPSLMFSQFMDVQRKVSILFIRPSRDGAVLCDWVWRACVHTGFRTITLVLSVYRIFTKLGRMIPLWKGKNPIYFGVIRSKVKVTVRCKYNF
jgi:hypothetical protein